MQIAKESYFTVVEQAVSAGFNMFENDYFWSLCGKSKPSDSLISEVTSFFKSNMSKREDEQLARDLFFIGAMVAIYTCEEYPEFWEVPKNYERVPSFYNAIARSFYSEKIKEALYPLQTNKEVFLRVFYRDLDIFRGDYNSAREKQLYRWTNKPKVKSGLEQAWTRAIFSASEPFREYQLLDNLHRTDD